MADGKPVIGSIPGLSNIFLATGHEGGGLCMALGTAEMVANLVLGKPGNFDYTPFAIQGRGLWSIVPFPLLEHLLKNWS